MMNLLIAGNISFTEDEISEIVNVGYDITFLPREDSKEISNPGLYDAVICNWLFMNHDIQQFKRLRYVQLLSAGMDRIPIEYIRQNGILIKNAHGVYDIPISEFVLMTVLDEYKHSLSFFENQIACRWVKDRDLDELSDKTLCILGAGSVGSEIARKFSMLVNRIVGIDLYPAPKKYFSDVVGLEQKDKILSESDIIVLALPLSKSTYHMFNCNLFNIMKDNAILINVARGALIDFDALKYFIDKGKFRSVILDVFENEPLDSSSWAWENKRVRIFPHNSFVSKKNDIRLKAMVIKNLVEFAAYDSLN